MKPLSLLKKKAVMLGEEVVVFVASKAGEGATLLDTFGIRVCTA